MKIRLNLELLRFPFILHSSFHTVLTFSLLVSSQKRNGTIQTLSSPQSTQLLHVDFFFCLVACCRRENNFNAFMY